MGKVRICALHRNIHTNTENILKIRGMDRLVSEEETGDKL
jgi:hypothetical protein